MKKHPVAFLIFLASLGLGLYGCKTITPPAYDYDPATGKLAEAATSVSHSLVRLAEVEQAQLPPKKMRLPNLDMPELISVDWSGPVEPLLRKMANASGYRLRVLGVQPAIPVLVTISAYNTPMSDVLRDVAFQCKTKADVVTFPDKRIIELRYAR